MFSKLNSYCYDLLFWHKKFFNLKNLLLFAEVGHGLVEKYLGRSLVPRGTVIWWDLNRKPALIKKWASFWPRWPDRLTGPRRVASAKTFSQIQADSVSLALWVGFANFDARRRHSRRQKNVVSVSSMSTLWRQPPAASDASGFKAVPNLFRPAKLGFKMTRRTKLLRQ